MVWGAQDAWRSHEVLRAKNFFEFMPGLRKALIAFGGFVVVEKAYTTLRKPADDHHDAHGAGHDDAHGAAHGHGSSDAKHH
jgi:hypothetical protein